MNDKTQKLIQVYKTLDMISVKGFSNCASLAAAMQVLLSVIQEDEKETIIDNSDKR